jgi:hypothetical protein
MKRLRVLMVCTVGIGVILIFAKVDSLKRTTLGHICRFILGSPGAQQWIDDLVDDVHILNRDKELIEWSKSIVQRAQNGEFVRGAPSNESRDEIRMIGFPSESIIPLPSNEIPSWLKDFWSEKMFGIPPRVVIYFSDDGRPRYVLYGWYEKGVAIGVADPKDIDFGPWGSKLASPGIYAYAMDK